MPKKTKKAFPKKNIFWILIAVLCVVLGAATHYYNFGRVGEIPKIDPMEAAYRQYMAHYAYPPTDDFLYLYDDGEIGAIRDGKMLDDRYKSQDAALQALGYDKDFTTAAKWSNNDRLLVVIRKQITPSFTAVSGMLTQQKVIGTGAESLQFLFYKDGLALAKISVPRESIMDVAAMVKATVKVTSSANARYGYELAVTNVRGRVDVELLAPKGLAGATVALNGNALAETKYDPVTGKCGFATEEFGTFGIFYAGGDTEPQPLPVDAPQFEVALEYANAYVYRVGNGNPVTLGTLFREVNTAAGEITVSFRNMDGRLEVTGAHNPASTWENSTVTFSGRGMIEITVNNCSLVVEIVDGYNITDGEAFGIAGQNAVLLGDITLRTAGALTISGGHTLYGNGFTITDGRTTTSGETGVVHIADGVVDNLWLIGYKSNNPAALVNDEGRAPALSIAGEASIYNSYIYGGRFAAQISSNGAPVYMENVTLDGGSRGNMQIASSLVTLKNCVTTTDTRGGLKGIGIIVTTTDTKLTLEGTFIQSNWLQAMDLPTTYSVLLSDIYRDKNYACSYQRIKYVNMGIFFFSEATVFTNQQAKSQIVDHTGNAYGYISKSEAGYTAACYVPKASMAEKTLVVPVYVTAGNHPNTPAASFDFTGKNYAGKMQGSSEYCVYNPMGYVDISFALGGSKVWDTDILTVTKSGQKIAPKVTMNGVDYTGKTITFTKAGEYKIVYTYTDTYNYRIPAEMHDVVYTKTVTVKVTAVDPNVKTYHPEFVYTDGSAATQIMVNDKLYVMPNVSGVSDKIGSTVVGGKTIYYPIVTIGGSGSDGSAYESGKIYCFAPAFTAINIKDYHKDTGALLYSYDKTTKTWPHNIAASTKINQSEYFGHGKTTPYTGATGDTYNVCQYNAAYGLSFVSSEIERNVKATTRLVEFYYVGNDGITYHYYIQYQQNDVAYEACVTADTLVTLADGSKKRIDQVRYTDMLLVWNFYTGAYDAMPASIIKNHGAKQHTVVTLNFADGTSVGTINSHGFFDADARKYVLIGLDNVENYIGHRFVKASGEGYTTTSLVSYSVKTEYTESWSILTAGQYNCVLADMWTITPAEVEGSPDYLMPFEMGADMKYDEAKLQADMEKYGVFTYADFADFMTEEQFDALGLSTWKVAIGKGYITWEDILYLVQIHIG